MLPQIKATPELSSVLQEIDRIKADLIARPPIPLYLIAEFEQYFLEDAVYHGMRLDSARDFTDDELAKHEAFVRSKARVVKNVYSFDDFIRDFKGTAVGDIKAGIRSLRELRGFADEEGT